MNESPQMPSIDVSKQGVRIDGELLDPLTLSALTRALGEPRDGGPTGDESTWAVWDELGLRAPVQNAPDGADEGADRVAKGLYVIVSEDSRRAAKKQAGPVPSLPTGIYTGQYTINGKAPLDAVPVKELRSAYIMLEFAVGDWKFLLMLNRTELADLHAMSIQERLPKLDTDELADMVRAAEHPITEIDVSYSPKPVVQKPSGRWKLPEATEPVLELKSFPWRLAVIEQLMYDQDLLQPRFDVHHFAQDRGAKNFDPTTYYDRAIPSVQAWFKKLPIPARLASEVEELVIDGGNRVYLQLIPQWDGEDDRFVIKTLTEQDLAPFTNLKRVQDIAGFVGPRAKKTLEAHGVEVIQ